MLRLLLLLLVGTAIAQESGDYAPEKDDQLIKAANEEVDHFDESLDEANDEEEDDGKDVSLCQEDEHIRPDVTEKAENDRCPKKRYHFFSDARTFFDAQHVCRYTKGSLSSIHNCEANNYLRSFMANNCRNGVLAWIGVWKRNTPFPYRNIDGSSLNYTNWGHGQHKADGQWCTAMNIRTGKWECLKCHSRLPFVCAY